MNSRQLAILASAYNRHGPRSGEPATPATVLAMTDAETLHGYVCDYYDAAEAGEDCLYQPEEICAAALDLESGA
jgi:hypothetical protein